MKHCAALAQCYKTLTVAHRSRCWLAVAPLQPRDTEGDSAAWDWWARWWRGALWVARLSPRAVLGVTGHRLLGSGDGLNWSTGEVLHVPAVPACRWLVVFFLGCHGLRWTVRRLRGD